MSGPVRLQLSRKRGFSLQKLSRETNGLEAVNVARPGPWGNQYIVGEDGDAATCVALYRKYVNGNIWSHPNAKEIKEELGGKNLACWCKPGEPCHADVLLELAANP